MADSPARAPANRFASGNGAAPIRHGGEGTDFRFSYGVERQSANTFRIAPGLLRRGGGWFLSRCPGHAGEWLALTGETIAAADALAFKLADVLLPSDKLAAVWD